jgi:ATP-dependent Clp protease ATP-binding subunit ClpA
VSRAETDPGTPKRHPIGNFDQNSKGVFTAAQNEAEARGGKFLLSGFILLAAASRPGPIAARLLESMKTDVVALRAAVDAEWASKSGHLQDRPPTLVNEAIRAVVNSTQGGGQAGVEALLAVLLGYEDSMATRVVARLGVDPKHVIAVLDS